MASKKDMFSYIQPSFSATGLIETGKALLAFANIVTALAIINIVYNQQHPLLYSIWVFFIFVLLYYIGYRLIKKGEKYV